MSLVADEVRRLDIQLDKFQFHTLESVAAPSEKDGADSHIGTAEDGDASHGALFPPKEVKGLKTIVRALSTTSTSQPLLRGSRLLDLLRQARTFQSKIITDSAEHREDGFNETDLEWMVVAKATVQTFGLVMDTMLQQTLPLSDGIWYWDEVLGSYPNIGLYTIQTSPIRLWERSMGVYQKLREKVASRPDIRAATVSVRWRTFYGMVQNIVQERSVADAKSKILSPFAMCRSEARRKRRGLVNMREMNASAIGLLMEESLSFEFAEDLGTRHGSHSPGGEEWRNTVSKSVLLMETVLKNVTSVESGIAEFEDTVFANIENDIEIVQTRLQDDKAINRPALVIERLIQILEGNLPEQLALSREQSRAYDRPSRLIRYWIPMTGLFFSLSTILRMLTNRRAEILTWIQDFGATTIDFWSNWVIDPTRRLIRTIRHDEQSEVAVLSKRSLDSDRSSLERMVVDFAVDRPGPGESVPSQAEIESLRLRVKEGDLTPVLKAYERDLRQPLVGTLRGDLIRTLLIQIQKTKVDVEIAMKAIDALLKSQELVFGFVGLTPGILVSYYVLSWVGSIFGSRKGLQQGKKKGDMIRALRNVDRVLTSSSSTTSNGILSYKDHGLLICEVHVLRQRAVRVLPGVVYHEFQEDINDLMDIRTGVEKQLRVVERIRWAYGKWLR
ncbi:Nuclear control of ATPase protein 2 [Arachnomyces sp. PD_36]|nr:Nuclear control of ATPase protein 2 [Arachnomyces sp. PD_36]